MGFGFGNCTKLHKRPAANQPAACQPGLLVCLHKSSSSALVRLSRYPGCISSLSNPLYLYLSFTLPCTGCTSSLSNPSANWRPPLLRTAGVVGLMQQCTHRIAPSQAQMNSALFQKWMYWLAWESRLHSTLCVRSAILAYLSWCCSEWDKVWSRLLSHLQPFFWLIARIFTIFDKKYSILTRRNKREPCLIVLQQKMFTFSLSLSGSLPVSLWLSMALCDSHSGSLWLPLALTYSLRLSLALSGSYWISPCLSLALYGSL